MAKKGTILIANQHTGIISIPRVSYQNDQRVLLTPLNLAPGTVTPVDAEEWTERRKNHVVQHYLDIGLLAEVKRDGAVPVLETSSTDLEAIIPDNLRTAEELGVEGSAIADAKAPKATVRKTDVATVKV